MLAVLSPRLPLQVFNRDEPDHEKELRVIVKANDKGVPSLEGTCAFVVNVLDVNDNAPMFDKSVSSLYLPFLSRTAS